jgi:hypothetical protein
MRRASILLALTALLAPAGVGASPAQERTSAPPVVFRDAVGDSGTGPDITTVTVVNDDRGQYTFDVRFTTPYTVAAALRIYLDTDLRPSTGDPQAHGADYLLSDDNVQQSFSFQKWAGSWKDAPTNGTVSDSLASDNRQLSMSVNSSELGNSKTFNFWVRSLDGDGSVGNRDDSPSAGSWRYTLQPVIHLSFLGGRSFFARAGGTWSVFALVGRSDNGGTVGPEGRIACRGTSGTYSLAVVRRYYTGGDGGARAAVCEFAVPLRLKNKVIHGTITVSYRGQSVTHTFTTRPS